MRLFGRVGMFGAAALLAVMPACAAPAQGPTIEIGESAWSAVPPVMGASGGEFVITVANLTDTLQKFAVVTISSGADADALPMDEGLLDVGFDGSYSSTYWIVHPDYERREGEGVTPDPVAPDTIEPGERKSVTIGGFKGGGEPGTYVVVSFEVGGYEADDYAVFTIVGET